MPLRTALRQNDDHESGARQIASPYGFGRPSVFMLGLLLFAAMAAIAQPLLAADAGDDSTTTQQPAAEGGQAKEDHVSKESTALEPPAPSVAPNHKAPSVCEALATAAAANELPVDFFTRLIWQESRFAPDAISPKGAQGIAQFMPATARSSGLDNPFNPLEAIAKSGELLRDLRREFGNLGLAAAAYNAGSGRVHDWLTGRRTLPRETRAYVRIVTGRAADEWTAGSRTNPVEMPFTEATRCDLVAAALTQPNHGASPSKETIKPWGVEIVGATTPEKALERYREWQPKFAAIVAGREPHVVIRGIIGQSGAARVRVDEDTRGGAEKLCAALKSAGTYCDVMRN
jgi:hypothetical protein